MDAQNWVIIPGTTQVKVKIAGKNFCLDAGAGAYTRLLLFK
jgi:hypothetical protein